MAATRLIALHKNKGKSIRQCLKDRTDYAQNGEKTNGGELVSSYACDPKTVEEEFAFSKQEYLRKTGRIYHGDILAYQIRQSFRPGEITPEEANRIGYETAMRWTKGRHAFIVATHVDRAHIHNHIIYNSTDLDCDRKFRDFFLCGLALQKLSDLVCLENGLSVIKAAGQGEKKRGTPHPRQESFRQKIRDDMDRCFKKNPQNMEELLRLLREMGYETKHGRHAAVKREGQKKFVRFRSLGAGYDEEDLEKRFSGEKTKEAEAKGKQGGDAGKKPHVPDAPKLDMLLNIQEMIARGKGPGYERWAKVHNVKQMAQTLLFLDEMGLRDYDELSKKARNASECYAEITRKQKELEERLSEITGLKKHILNYSKTRETYEAYRRSGYSRKYFEEHREEILLHKAAKEAFTNLKGPIPKIRELNEEYDRILKEKKKTYAEYRQVKQDMKNYQTAKYNVDQFLRKQEEEQREEQKKRERKFR